ASTDPSPVIGPPPATGPPPVIGPPPVAGPLVGAGTRLLPDGVPLDGLLAGLSGLVNSSRPWWTPSGIEAVFPPPGLTINVDVTVPLDLLLPAADDGGARAPTANNAGSGQLTAMAEVPAAPEVTTGRSSAPVPAITARALALGGTWRRLVTDPLSGAVIDVGRTHYRPPAGLRDLVQARDATCTHPGCQVPAARCDIDHIVAWADGGTTSLDNLTVLCQAHHRLKHAPGWRLTREDDGTLMWATPTGARYRRSPDGAITVLPRKVGPRQLFTPARPVPERLAAAVNDAVVTRLQRGLNLAAEEANSVGRPPCLTSRGPRPGERPGAFETTAYPEPVHELGLAPLLDEVPPF
ncbi:HNH endonuclease signature motif containing protein, partial [Actinomyces sp. MRS3W]|uniref:HNH endonuclease signature motif containing protein n=1 Tax=Actinomyces sp. MRS3W TaxID=2800796 RepID=UPI0028FD9593